ncbi:MAG TPA: prepilin-type N-terminal cleavage/methylation domain-containing protein, partial [Verrucomicrobiae bacterium]|nr:prepilin-type N-terminal cleavage/methylation domain-containing protein [Verrucomicrobiae bacterium]
MFAPGTARPVSARLGRQRPAVRILFLKKAGARLSPSRCFAVSPFRRSKSFTLLELLVVVGIIGLLLVLLAD